MIRRLFCILALIGAFAAACLAQTSAVSGTSAIYAQLFKQQTATGRSLIFADVRNIGITNHVFQWTTVGAPATCTLLIEKSNDAVSWSTESTQTCTSSGTFSVADANHLFLTANLTALTGGVSPNLSANYRGYLPGQGFPVRAGEGGTGTTTVFTAGSVPFVTGSSGVYLQDNTNFFWDNSNKRLCLLGNTCTNSLEVGAAKFLVTAAGAATTTGGLTAKPATAASVAATVQGLASQTGDLQQWTDSAAVVVGSVSSAGIPKGKRLTDNVPLHGTAKADYTVTTVANTVTETALNSYTVPANTLAANRAFRVTATGVYSTANGTDTATLRFKVAGVTWHSVVSTAAAVTNVQWSAEWLVIAKTISATGDAESQLPHAFINSVFKTDPNTAVESLDTTVSRLLEVTIQWSAAVAGHTWSIRQFAVEVLN